MKRLLLATFFLLVLMGIGTSVAFAGSFQPSSNYFKDQRPAVAKNIMAGR